MWDFWVLHKQATFLFGVSPGQPSLCALWCDNCILISLTVFNRKLALLGSIRVFWLAIYFHRKAFLMLFLGYGGGCSVSSLLLSNLLAINTNILNFNWRLVRVEIGIACFCRSAQVILEDALCAWNVMKEFFRKAPTAWKAGNICQVSGGVLLYSHLGALPPSGNN